VKASRALLLVVVLAAAAFGSWFLIRAHQSANETYLTLYYTKLDGTTLGTWQLSLRPRSSGESAQEHLQNVLLYAAVQSLAGPPDDVQAIRFPPGTRVLGVMVNGSIVTVDLSKDIDNQGGGTFGENGEFKGLVYTLTGIPPIDAVQIMVAGHILDTLPGGHLEIDTPLRRSDW
jgi:spore germination protein GerM